MTRKVIFTIHSVSLYLVVVEIARQRSTWCSSIINNDDDHKLHWLTECLRRWLIRPIRAQSYLPQIAHFGPAPLGDWVVELAALAFRAARLLSAVALRRCCAEKAPLLIRLRHDGRFKPRSSQASTGNSKLFRVVLTVFEAELESSKFALSFCQFAV